MTKTFQEAEALLAEALPGYEPRSQQQAFAGAIEQAIFDGTHLIAEAGCGTGKSFGYLIPAILSGKRVVVSTATKALQDQIVGKDLPFLAEHLDVEFTYALLKGRSNYLCPDKAATSDGVADLARILRRADDADFNGERSDLGFEVSHGDWSRVSADSDDCSALGCKGGDTCFAERARKAAREAQVVVVNHALLFTDVKVSEISDGYGSMLGDYDLVIFDEAHECEEYASSTLGSRFTEGSIRRLVSEVRNFVRQQGLDDSAVQLTSGEALGAMTGLWEVLEEGRIRQHTITTSADLWEGLARALYELADATRKTLSPVANSEFGGKEVKRARLLTRRAGNTADRFASVLIASFDDLVRWVEVEGKGRGPDSERKVIQTAPISVADYLREQLFSKRLAILVSATLLIKGSAEYIAGRLGVDDHRTLDVGTPFDYSTQALLYVPGHLPEPSGKGRVAWESMAVTEIIELLRASEGRALLLFTSTKQMRSAHAAISERLPWTCLIQGQRPNKALAEEFERDTNSVLFATRSFFTGVDFQGDTCSLVVMDKLPFPVPTDPVIEARCEAIKRAGESDWNKYVVPVMSLTLKQGFGRLIRHRNDRGVVAILDPRLVTKGYGKGILASLPPAPRVTAQGDVESFYAAQPAGV